MPVYEYRCTACNHQFELRQKFSDPPADHCPKCGGIVRKMVSASAFSLKGGGWYGDGYNAKADEAPKSESASTAETGVKTDSAVTDSTTRETTAAPVTSSTQSETETKSAVAEKPAVTEKPKSE